MQRRYINIIKYIDSLNVFKNKLKNRKRKIELNNFTMFEELSSVFTTNDDIEILPEL